MKKYLSLLTITLFLTYNGFSQTATEDSSQIRLSEQVARLVITDLITGDQAKEENPELRKIIQSLTHKSVVQDSIITTQDKQLYNYKEIIRLKDLEIKAQDRTLDSIEEKLRKERLKKMLYGISTAAVTVTSVMLLVMLK